MSGAQVGVQGPDGKTPLHVASEVGDLVIVRALLTSTTFKRSMVDQVGSDYSHIIVSYLLSKDDVP